MLGSWWKVGGVGGGGGGGGVIDTTSEFNDSLAELGLGLVFISQ